MKTLEIGDKVKFIDAMLNKLTQYEFKIDNHEDLMKSYTNDANYHRFEFCYNHNNNVTFYEAYNYHAKPIEIHSSDILTMELEVTDIKDYLLED